MSEVIDRAMSILAALRREPLEFWDDEHCLDNGQAAVTITALIDEVHRLQYTVDSFTDNYVEMSYRGRLVPITSQGMRVVIDDNLRLYASAYCPTTNLLNALCSCWRHGPESEKSVDKPDVV